MVVWSLEIQRRIDQSKCQVKSLTLKVTPSATQFFKGLTKLAVILDYKRPWVLCLALQSGQKSGMILPSEVVLKLKLPKNHLTKNVLLKSYSSMKKKSERFK